MNRAELIEGIARLARDAGREIMAVYATDFAVEGKADESPVTDADRRAERVIIKGLSVLTPGYPVIAEEQAAAGNIPQAGNLYWLVDPLDGTREFIKRNGEFTVNIGLIEAGKPVLGVVFAPALDQMYAGGSELGAWMETAGKRRAIASRAVPEAGLTVAACRSHGDNTLLEAFLAGRVVAAQRIAGSSLKFCLIAAAEADLYARFGRTMEWDTAAGHAVLAAAGGSVTDVNGRELGYGKPGLENPHFVAWGRGPEPS